MKAVPGNVRRGIEQRAQQTADKIVSLPAELKQAAASAAVDAAASLKQRAALKTKALYRDEPTADAE